MSHEALIRQWPRLGEWMREVREDIPLQRAISVAVADWEQRGKPADHLYRGSQLKEALAWAKRNTPSKNEVAFLRASSARRRRWVVSVSVIMLLLLATTGVASWYALHQPADPTLVTKLQDSVSGSLRYCIDNAPSGSTIRFAPDLSGTIKLTGGGLAIAGGKQLTIIGPGADQLTISGGNLDAIIHVSKGAILNISRLSLTNSETINDAFLFNEGTLILTNSIISDNKTIAGGAIFINSVLSGGNSLGGGIENEGQLTVVSSTFSHNSASSSGSNSSSQAGGIANIGLHSVSQGGGIYFFGSYDTSAADIRFCTIYGNSSSIGGGISVDPTGKGQMRISSSIVAANRIRPNRAPEGPDISGTLISDGYNRIGNVAGANVQYATTDRQVTYVDLNIDSTLHNNGGPTWTLALRPRSPAIDIVPRQACSITVTDASGHTKTINTDQRGDPRPDGSENACDIGAYESSY
jgi:hypothetical protein